MTVWDGAEEPEPGFCEQLGLGSLQGFGDVDGRVRAEVSPTDTRCIAAYREGAATLTVHVRRHPDETAARAAFAAVPAIGTTSEPVPGWDDGRFESGETPAGWTARQVVRRGTSVAEISLVLSPELVPSTPEATWSAVSRVTAVVDVLLKP